MTPYLCPRCKHAAFPVRYLGNKRVELQCWFCLHRWEDDERWADEPQRDEHTASAALPGCGIPGVGGGM